jgi:CRP-like cAMP-binding protein
LQNLRHLGGFGAEFQVRGETPNPLITKLVRGGVPEHEVHAALSFGRRRAVLARQEISSSGAQILNFTALMSGIACRYKMVGDGRRAIIGFVLPGDFTTPIFSEPMRPDFGVMSLTTLNIIELPCAELLARAQNNPQLSRALTWTAIVDGNIARTWLANLAQQPAEKRTAHLLCELRHRLALVGVTDQKCFSLPLTQQDLCDALGVSVVHVNRVLQRLSHLGLAHHDHQKIIIPDAARFEQFAEFSPAYLHPDAPETALTGSN